MQSIIEKFRIVGFIEGISYLVLLLIAMPLKYIYGMPEAVKVVGMAHGVLFILFVLLLALSAKQHQWSLKFNSLMFVASLIPFGTFYTDRRLKAMQTV
ncbi:MAG: DUF3817 domain-containing protein [Campylobacterota bacterium]|nr:DUF3817 domain-containing protein [Campylobacterota bacterium]